MVNTACMKKNILYFLVLIVSNILQAQTYAPYYYQRKTAFEQLPVSDGSTIFCGDSITDGAEWSELFGDPHILNRGISGDIAEGVLNRVTEMAIQHPAKLFLLIGINDLAAGSNTTDIASRIRRVIDTLQQLSPQTGIYLQSVLPVNASLNRFPNHTNKKDSILRLNLLLETIAHTQKIHFINLYPAFSTGGGSLDTSYTNDGLHLNGTGYQRWKTVVYPFVYGIGEKPAIIPAPLHLQWGKKNLLLGRSLQLSADAFMQTQLPQLKKILDEKKIRYNEQIQVPTLTIRLRKEIMPEGYLANESYRIQVKDSQVLLAAGTTQGMFYAIQTLRQLLRDGAGIPECEIYDKPSFAWRGIMHDVGRNYQSVQQLKQQIDILAKYKLNRFHFHLTEDIAWRMQSKRYPQLTDAATMQRNPGEYYSIDELKELVAYCRERFITLVPELDMPGHSAAFKRALGVDMQSDEGIRICSELIREFCENFDLPYIHIGGDEVKISRPDFLPAICRLLSEQGKQALAWDPGGNVPAGTILQMWNGNTMPKKDRPSLDSRHLYMNHHDPIDGVVSVFNHRICDVETGDSMHLGAIACIWPDRRVSTEADILRMNPVYPEILTLAERSWKGGGWKNYLSDISLPGEERYTLFHAFEQALTEHQLLYYKELPFPYVKQSNIQWQLSGPYDNKGNTATVFDPEKDPAAPPSVHTKKQTIWGGTIFLRHFWAPLIGSHIAAQKENSTYYASTSIYSNREQSIGLWIGFYNISRSNNTATPQAGSWDNRNSRIWLNGKEILPPAWSKAGRHPAGMEEPLIDEGYEYRTPATVTLHKGWNRILLKAPVASLRSADWQSPVKWMFSCMPVSSSDGILYRQPEGLLFDPFEGKTEAVRN